MTLNFTNQQYLNILQSLGQSVHIFDTNGRIIYWNHMAEQLYGYSASEALGKNGLDLICDPRETDDATEILNRNSVGENWTGQFPVRNKLGQPFLVVATNTPFYDDLGNLVGIVCVSCDAKPFREVQLPFSEGYKSSGCPRSGLIAKPEHPKTQRPPLQVVSKLSNMASIVTNKVRSKIGTAANTVEKVLLDYGEDATTNGASTLRGDIPPSPFGTPFKAARGEKYPREHFIISRAEAWISKKGIIWPREGSEHDRSIVRTSPGVCPWLNHDQENEYGRKGRSDTNPEPEFLLDERNQSENDFGRHKMTSVSSVMHKVDMERYFLDYDISWEDLKIGERIGRGSCGTVFRGLWCGSDVAIKVFDRIEYSDDLLDSFRQEVSFMKRLRHPNVLLFMGTVISPLHLCIVTEFLPRGSLFQLIQHDISRRLDWRRRVLMALDIARGMNYLHHRKPPIVHRDLKSSNLLVDKSWTVKVGDFGLSQLKHCTFLTTRSWKGTPQWMAPEVLRSDPSDEKSDVYSYGVILWELATQKIPWDNLNPLQVIGAVGFMDERLEIPKEMDSKWVSIIESCWHSKPKCRPTFKELLVKLKDLLRHYPVHAQATRLVQGDNLTTLAAT